MSTEVKIEGLDKLVKKLGQIEADKVTRQALRKAGKNIIHEASEYPTQPAPKNPKYRYIRGSGTMYVPTGRIQKTSEVLGKKWYIKGEPRKVTVGNRASYAPYVQGEEQASLHKRTGWKRLDKTAEEQLPDIVKEIQQEIERKWRQ